MFAQLGNIVFDGVLGFTDYTEKGSNLMVEHQLIFGKPSMQNTGNALDELNISMRFHVAFCNPLQQINQLKNSRQTAEILSLVWGNSVYQGQYVIVESTQTTIQTDGQGNIFEATYDITLKEYVDPDPLGAKSANAKSNAFALNTSTSGVNSAKNPSTSPQLSVMKSIQTANNASSKIAKDANTLQSDLTQAQEISKRVADNLQKAENAYQQAQDALNQADSLKAKVLGLYNTLTGAITTIKNLKNQMPITTSLQALTISQGMTGASKGVSDGATTIAGFLATQRTI